MKLIKTSIFSFLNILLRIVFGLVLNKIIALSGGPSGLAIFAQFQNLIQLSVQGSQLGILSGYSKYLVNYRKKYFLKNVLRNTTLLILSSGTILGIVFIVFFSEFILASINSQKNSEIEIVLFIIAFGLIFYNFGAYLISTLVGLELPVHASLLNLFQTSFLILIAIPMAFFFGVLGAVVGLILSQIIWSTLAVLLVKVPGSIWPKRNISWYSFGIGRRLAGYMLSGVVVAVAGPLSMFLIRSHSIDILGSDLVGYWQSAQTISGIYISIIATIIATYFYPKFSSSIRGKPKFFIIRELLKSLLFSLIICFLFCSFLFTFKKSIFSIAFSNEFTAVSNFIGYQILGDLFRVIIVNVSYFLLARGEQLKFISIEIISAVSYTILVYFTVHSGIVDIFYSYIMSGIITLFSASIIMVFHCRREIKCRH